jgi:hypothetical protein
MIKGKREIQISKGASFCKLFNYSLINRRLVSESSSYLQTVWRLTFEK